MGLLNVGTQALKLNQAALQTVGNNIANINTPGYSRQSVVQQSVMGQNTGNGYIGSGVQLTTVERTYSEFLTRQAALTSSIASMDVARSSRLNQLQDVFQTGKSGLGAAISGLLNSFSDVASSPTDLTARTVAMSRAQELVSRFQNTARQIDEIKTGVSQDLNNSIGAINNITKQIAALNNRISSVSANGQPPNELLDQRDQLIADLSVLVQVSTVKADDGSLNVFMGSQALVLGNDSNPVSLAADDFGQPNRRLAVSNGSITNYVDPNLLGGGSAVGLMKFLNNDISAASDLLGRMALALTTEVNAQHHMGLDLDGNPGKDFFTPITLPDGIPSNKNTGNPAGSISVTLGDASKLNASGYQVSMTGATTGSITRLSDGQTFSFDTSVDATSGAASTQGGVLNIDGLKLTLSGSANNKDQFLVQPLSTAAAAMGTTLSSGRELAVSSRVEPALGSSNKGSLTVTGLSTSPNGFVAPTQAGITLSFTAGPPPQYSSDSGATQHDFVAGQPITIQGWSLTLQGIPADGDTITIKSAAPSEGGTGYYRLNASNAQSIVGLSDKPLFDGISLADGYSGLIAQIGTRTQSAQYAANVSGAIAANTESDRASVAGVSLDEEASKLLQYQQAYQASSKMIQVSQSIFDTLVQSLGR